MSERSDTEDDLRATSDALRRDANRLVELEEAKSHIDAADPLMDQISYRVEDLAREIEEKSRAERHLSEQIRSTDGGPKPS